MRALCGIGQSMVPLLELTSEEFQKFMVDKAPRYRPLILAEVVMVSCSRLLQGTWTATQSWSSRDSVNKRLFLAGSIDPDGGVN